MKKEGFLKKEGGKNKTWHERHIELNHGGIHYYTKDDHGKLKGEIPLNTVTDVSYLGDYSHKKFVFAITTPTRTYYMRGKTEEESREWVGAVKKFFSSDEGEHPTHKVGVRDFEKLKVIGKGAFGKVYLVRKKDTQKVYAMKQLDKKDIKDRDEVEHTKTERSVLSHVEHPFISTLHYSFQTTKYLYFVMEFVNGGEVFHHLSKERRFDENRAKFYAAEILLGLSYLHSKGVIYRDLKPENLLLDYQGHIVITDFGLSKEGLVDPTSTTSTFCGTPEYLAPEVIRGEDYTKNVDWWSLGILLCEMISGLPPFNSKKEEVMYQKIVNENIEIPDYFSQDARDLIQKLCDRNPQTRLQDPEIIKAHPFFNGIDWGLLIKKEVAPPFVPHVLSPEDTGNVDPDFLQEEIDSDDGTNRRKESQFVGFTYKKEEEEQENK